MRIRILNTEQNCHSYKIIVSVNRWSREADERLPDLAVPTFATTVSTEPTLQLEVF
jgi:hypothetical protein